MAHPYCVNLARAILRDATMRAPTRRCGGEVSTVASSAALLCRATAGGGGKGEVFHLLFNQVQ